MFYNRGVLVAAVHVEAIRHALKARPDGKITGAGFLDLMAAAFISTSALKPLHVFGRIGIGFLVLGLLPLMFFVSQYLHHEPLHVRPLMLIGVGLVLVGFQFVLMGLLGEMIAHMGARAEYPVRSRYGGAA